MEFFRDIRGLFETVWDPLPGTVLTVVSIVPDERECFRRKAVVAFVFVLSVLPDVNTIMVR